MATLEGNRRRRAAEARAREVNIAAHEEAAEALIRLADEYEEAAQKSDIAEFKEHVRATYDVVKASAQKHIDRANELKARRGTYQSVDAISGEALTIKYPKDGCTKAISKIDYVKKCACTIWYDGGGYHKIALCDAHEAGAEKKRWDSSVTFNPDFQE